MKRKNFKIKKTTLFVYTTVKATNHYYNETEPTVSILTTTVTSSGIFNVAN